MSDVHSSKVFGISLSSIKDSFVISLPQDIKDNPVTKRNILSQIYDPIGFDSPVFFVDKMLIQKIWLASVKRNQDLDDQLKSTF